MVQWCSGAMLQGVHGTKRGRACGFLLPLLRPAGVKSSRVESLAVQSGSGVMVGQGQRVAYTCTHTYLLTRVSFSSFVHA